MKVRKKKMEYNIKVNLKTSASEKQKEMIVSNVGLATFLHELEREMKQAVREENFATINMTIKESVKSEWEDIPQN